MSLANIQRAILHPYPLRGLFTWFVQKFNVGSYPNRLKISAVDRPQYGYCVYHSAVLAKRLGHKKISMIEFGVAGGNGLVSLEEHAAEVSKILDVEIEIYGFDTGEGLPEPLDYRDLEYFWQPGFYKMDVPKLKSRLKHAKLVLGNIEKTSQSFFEEYNPAPVAAVFHDFDFYSSTAVALKMFEENYHDRFLPRVFCYFDDVIGSDLSLYNEYTGELRAINEFNEEHEDIKICQAHHLIAKRVVFPWYHQIRVTHFFQHQDYSKYISDEISQLPLE